MNCSFSQPLNDDDFATAMDDVADDAVRQHLKQCPYCQARFEKAHQAARDFDGRLRSVIFRLACPPSITFVELFFGYLAPAENLKLKQHLEICPRCRKDYDELGQFMQLTESKEYKPKPISRLGQLVAVLVSAPADFRVTGLRGDSSGFVFEAEGTTIYLTPQQRATGRYLAGQVMAVSEVNNWAGALVELRQSGELKATAIIDENGRFTCPLTLGEPIELRITNDQNQSILVKGIELRE